MAVEETQSQNQAPKKDAAPEGKKVRLLARLWEKPVKFDKDGKPTNYRKYRRGDVLTVTEEEFERLNAFKKSFEEVDG